MPNRQSLTLRAKISPWLALGLLMNATAYAATTPAVDPLAQSTTSATVIDPLAQPTVDPLATSIPPTDPTATTIVAPMGASSVPIQLPASAQPIDSIPTELPVEIDPALVPPPAQ